VYAQAYLNGTAFNAELEEEPVSSARIYTETYVRHWDTWLTDKRNNVFGGTLTSADGSYTFDGQLRNFVAGLSNLTRAESPVAPFGGASDYDISPDGQQVAFLTKNIDLPLANYTSSQIWLVPFSGGEPQVLNGLGAPSTPAGAEGASAGPVFSPDSSKIAYLQMDLIEYESDRNKIYIANADAAKPQITVLAEDWDVSPAAVKWSANGTSVVVDAPHRGNDRMFEPIPLDAGADFAPKNITDRGSVAAFFVLPDDNLLVSDAKMWSARDIYIISPSGEVVTDLFHANAVDPGYEGLDPSIQDEFYYPGNFTDVQSFIVYPQNFDPSKKYPLAFIIHGGPQAQHQNSFSTRWNFKVWADQGYVVIAPNPTGSNGFGEAFQDAIQNNWGSYPYDDLVKCWNYVKENYDFIDTDNGIAAGASYGGYMTNWIQGHDLGREFKALVTHDGSLNTLAQYTSEELWFMQHDFNGTLWDDRANYERWNPIDHILEWSTPQFVIHNTLDYRLPEAEGIMLFNILQARGIPSKFLNFPDENHWVLNRENSLVWHREIFKWINHYSGLSQEGPY
jgi:dipeptidyl aminopeptidase/acylaminoacyl peptidase